MRLFRHEYRLTLYLLLLCAILIALLAMESRNGIVTGISRQPAAGGLPYSSGPVTYSAPAISAFDTIIERPLFMENRRPLESSPALPEPAPTAPELRLVLEGIAITPKGSIALLRNPADKRLLRLVIGKTHLGWKLVAIDSSSVMFQRDEASVEIPLQKSDRTKPGR